MLFKAPSNPYYSVILRFILGQQSRDDIPCFGYISGFTLRSLLPLQTHLFLVVVLVLHLTFHFKPAKMYVHSGWNY